MHVRLVTVQGPTDAEAIRLIRIFCAYLGPVCDGGLVLALLVSSDPLLTRVLTRIGRSVMVEHCNCVALVCDCFDQVGERP